jgi:Uma2 family endonuclease
MSDGSVAMVDTYPKHKFSVEDYHRMVEAGILTEYDKVELIRGELVLMSPIGSRHAACVSRLNDLFEGLRAKVLRYIQNPVRLEDSEPEPDFVLLGRKDDYYASGHPVPADVHLVIEVADTSQRFDRDVKGPLYAENGIREYWLVDVEADRVEVHRRPEGAAWREVTIRGRGESISPEAFPDFSVRLDDVLP